MKENRNPNELQAQRNSMLRHSKSQDKDSAIWHEQQEPIHLLGWWAMKTLSKDDSSTGKDLSQLRVNNTTKNTTMRYSSWRDDGRMLSSGLWNSKNYISAIFPKSCLRRCPTEKHSKVPNVRKRPNFSEDIRMWHFFWSCLYFSEESFSLKESKTLYNKHRTNTTKIPFE